MYLGSGGLAINEIASRRGGDVEVYPYNTLAGRPFFKPYGSRTSILLAMGDPYHVPSLYYTHTHTHNTHFSRASSTNRNYRKTRYQKYMKTVYEQPVLRNLCNKQTLLEMIAYYIPLNV